MIRSVESAKYLILLGAPYAIRGLYADLIILDKSLRALLPARNLLHPVVVATVARAYDNFDDLVINAGLKACRSAARRINAAASFVRESLTKVKCLTSLTLGTSLYLFSLVC